MFKKPLLSGLMLAAVGVAAVSAATTAEAHHLNGNPDVGFGLSFGSPGYYDNGYYDDRYYDNGYGYYDNGYGNYDHGYYDGGYNRSYRHHSRPVSHHCHVGKVQYHHRLHAARICDGQVKVIY